MMSLSGNTFQRTFLWNVSEETGTRSDPRSTWVSCCVQNRTDRTRPQGQWGKSQDRRVKQTRVQDLSLLRLTAGHRTDYCAGFTPWSPQLWAVSGSTDAVQALGWLNNRSAHSARPGAWYGAGVSALRRVLLTISQDVGWGLQSSKKWKLTKTEHSIHSVKCQVFFILKNRISSNVLPTW